MTAATERESEAERRGRLQRAEQRLERIVGHHVGDATPGGVDQGAAVSRRGIATVAVANGPLDQETFAQALRGARKHGRLVRFRWSDREWWTLPEEELLLRVQREAGERGDADTVATAQQVLSEVRD